MTNKTNEATETVTKDQPWSLLNLGFWDTMMAIPLVILLVPMTLFYCADLLTDIRDHFHQPRRVPSDLEQLKVASIPQGTPCGHDEWQQIVSCKTPSLEAGIQACDPFTRRWTACGQRPIPPLPTEQQIYCAMPDGSLGVSIVWTPGRRTACQAPITTSN